MSASIKLLTARVLISIICGLLIYRGFSAVNKSRSFKAGAFGRHAVKSISGPKDISWKEANYYIGELVRVRGQIVGTYKSSKVIFLNFARDYRTGLTIVIFKDSFGKFKTSPDIMFKGQEIEVEGVLKEYKGRPEIIIDSSEQIRIIRQPGSSK